MPDAFFSPEFTPDGEQDADVDRRGATTRSHGGLDCFGTERVAVDDIRSAIAAVFGRDSAVLGGDSAVVDRESTTVGGDSAASGRDSAAFGSDSADRPTDRGRTVAEPEAQGR